MYRIFEYTLFFVTILLLQGLLFGNMDMGMLVDPLVYIAFIVLLPMDTAPVVVLLSGFTMGAGVDFLSGTAGLNTIAALFTAFCRPYLLTFMLGKEVVRDGGAPLSSRLGTGKFLRCVTIAVFLHCIVLFSLETLSWKYFHITLAKIAFSTLLTVFLIYFSQMLLIGNYRRSAKI